MTQIFLNRLAIEPIRSSRPGQGLASTAISPSSPPGWPTRWPTPSSPSSSIRRSRLPGTPRSSWPSSSTTSRNKLGEAEGRLNQFLKVNDILFVTTDKSLQPQDLTTQQLTMLSDALLKARHERIAKQSLVAGTTTRDVETLPAVLQSPLISQLKQQLGEIEAEHKKLAQVFKPDYPRMQQLTQKVAESRRLLRMEIERAIQALHAEYEAAARNERELEAALAQQRRLARGLSESMAQYNLLRREVDTNRDLYSALLARLRETQISAALFTSNISVVDRAEVPPVPSRPRRSQSLFVACVLGLMSGIGLAFLLEYLDTNIKDAREVESVLRVPILGMVPSWHGPRRLRDEAEVRPGRALGAGLALRRIVPQLVDEPALLDARSSPEDAHGDVAAARGRQDFAGDEPRHHAGPARRRGGAGGRRRHATSQSSRDPGRGPMARPVHVPHRTGPLDQVIVPTAVPNLFTIPAGRSPLNPAELLASGRLGQALETLGQRYTHIVLDTGPMFGVSDATILAARVEGVVLVLRQGRASRDVAQRAIRNLLSVRSRLLGVILNDVEPAWTRLLRLLRSIRLRLPRPPKTKRDVLIPLERRATARSWW